MRFGNNSCMHCTNRKSGCHATCELYKADKLAYEKEKEHVQRLCRPNNVYYGYKKPIIERVMKCGIKAI